MRLLGLVILAVGLFASSAAEAGHGTHVRIRSGGPGRGNADRTRIDVRSGHDRTKIDVRGDRVRVDVRGHDPHHDARIRRWHELRARFGGPHFVVTGPLRLELRAHARRVAWLRRIRIVAISVGDVGAVGRVDDLLGRETVRHEAHVSAMFSVH